MGVNEMYSKLLEMGVSEDALQLVVQINGYSEETMYDVLYAVFAETSFEEV